MKKKHLTISPFAKARFNFKRIKKILIVRHDRLGDTVLTLPLATLLKQQFPQLEIHVLLKSYTVALAAHHPAINKILVLPDNLDDKKNYQQMVATLRAENYDLSILIPSKTLMAKLLWDAKIPARIGMGSKLYSWRSNAWYPQRPKGSLQHEGDYILDIIRDFVNVPSRAEIPFTLKCSAQAEQTIQAFLAHQQIQHYTIIHPGSGGSAVDLPIEQYAKLIAAYRFPGTLIITGSEKEKHLYQTLAPHAQQSIVDATDKFSVDELMCLISHCDLLLSNSTGPLHIARAYHRKILGFYCTQSRYHPKRWGPYGQEEEYTFLPAGEDFSSTQDDGTQTIIGMQQIAIPDIMRKLDTILGL